MNWIKRLFTKKETTKQCDIHVVRKSFPLIEGKTKSNVKKYNGVGRQAPPPKRNKVDSINFTDWLMTNCELSEDQTIWSYDSEDYTLEELHKIYLNK